MLTVKKRIADNFLLTGVLMLALMGQLISLPFFINPSGVNLFIFETIGSGCIILGILIFIVLMWRYFGKRHPLFKQKSFLKDEIVASENNFENYVYLILEGTATVFTKNNGIPKLIAKFKAGDIMGKAALLNDEKDISITIHAATPLKVTIIDKSVFDNMNSHLPFVKQHFEKACRQRVEADH